MPPTDQHFKYLVAAGLQENISLRKVFFVNSGLAGDNETRKVPEDRVFGLFRRELFEQGIIELVQTDIREFLAGPRNMGEGSYRVRIGRPLNPHRYSGGPHLGPSTHRLCKSGRSHSLACDQSSETKVAQPKNRKKPPKTAEAYRHGDAESPLRPEIGTQAQFKKRKPPVTYRYDSSLSPRLDWDGQNYAREVGESLIAEVLKRLQDATAAAQKKSEKESEETLRAQLAELETALSHAREPAKQLSGRYRVDVGGALSGCHLPTPSTG